MTEMKSQHPFYVERFGPIQWSDQEPDNRSMAQFWIAVDKSQNTILEAIQGPVNFSTQQIREEFRVKIGELRRKYPYDHQASDGGKFDVVVLTGHLESDGSPDINELGYHLPTIINWEEIDFEVFQASA